MKIPQFLVIALLLTSCTSSQESKELFNGQTFQGWEGDTVATWRIEDGSIVGGSLSKTVPHNDFLVTTQPYNDFMLRLKFKLLGDSGFINAGVQFHSQRLDDPPYEMVGYQADLGEGYWASLYDESRRKKTLVQPDSVLIMELLKPDDWNDYEIRAEDGYIQLWLNGQQTVDYIEADKAIPQSGFIGLQIHGGGKAQVFYKDIMLEELP
uniref:DUF1080 domain-containing protein n=1 Tax=Roseihalotalea indica TaxID=2867963 RepID=A0AA49GS83_9BACT|nr:DUF1080 domain-containing protein [Tunicatimonas sp. TK19036]